MYSHNQHSSLTGDSGGLRATFLSSTDGPTLTTHSDPYRNGQDDMVRDLIYVNRILADTYILARILGSILTTATLLVPLAPSITLTLSDHFLGLNIISSTHTLH